MSRLCDTFCVMGSVNIDNVVRVFCFGQVKGNEGLHRKRDLY